MDGTTLSPPCSIVTWSTVSGAPGIRWVASAAARATDHGTCTSLRRLPSTFAIRRYSSFHVTVSGPPISKVRPAACGRSIAFAKYAATSSTQIGCDFCSPGPITVTTGESLTWRMNVGSTPPSRPKTKLGRKITYSSADPLTSCSICHFAA